MTHARTLSVAGLLCIFCSVASARQQSSITGRVVGEDGGGLPNMTVTLRAGSSSAGNIRQAVTDEEGYFRFTGLASRSYSISVMPSRGYVRAPVTAAEREQESFNRIGDNVTIKMIRGGVITGRVITANNEPVILVSVAVIMVLDADGNRIQEHSTTRPTMTDDRGSYRLYGLSPGTYLVMANGGSQGFSSAQSAYGGEVPTYYPSATTLDTAAEVKVVSGAETKGIDIRYRSERGHTISGRITGSESFAERFAANVSLTNAETGAIVDSNSVSARENKNGFAFNGVPNGEYILAAAIRDTNTDEAMASPPRRVTVRDADVSGLELRLALLASIAGRVVIESVQNSCDESHKPRVEEVLLNVRLDGSGQKEPATSSLYVSSGITPDEKGEFLIRNLQPGQYRIVPRLTDESLYVNSILLQPSSPVGKASLANRTPIGNAILRSAIPLKSGEKSKGVIVKITQGSATLQGRVIAEKEGVRLPMGLRVLLIPAETTATDDLLRYAETLPSEENAFAFTNIAPGRYWLIAHAIASGELADRSLEPVVWNPVERAKLRREAEAAKNEIQLQPCQRVKDHVLRMKL